VRGHAIPLQGGAIYLRRRLRRHGIVRIVRKQRVHMKIENKE